jgi:hypothetical protein
MQIQKQKSFLDGQMGWCITDSRGSTSPCTFAEASLVKLGWNFTDISGVLTRIWVNGEEVVIDLNMPKVRGNYSVFKLDKYREGIFEEVENGE